MNSKFVAAVLAISVLALVGGPAFALQISDVGESMKSPDKQPMAKSGMVIFHFTADNLCSKTTNLCVMVSGSGNINFRGELSASGYFAKYQKDSMRSASEVVYYTWTAKELVDASAIRIHFKAKSSLGSTDIAVTEGKTPSSGLVCVWGALKGVAGPSETLCTNNVRIYVV